jgi:single-strand DNA-binding protein
MNTVNFIGNAGQEPTIKTLDNGTIVAKFNVATKETYTDKEGAPVEKTTWHRIVAWNKAAEAIAKTVHKGSFIHIKAKVVTNEYDKVIKVPISAKKTIDHTIKVKGTEFQAFEVTVLR